MCHAIIEVVYSDGHRERIDVETSDALPDRIAKIEGAQQADRYAVFVMQKKVARVQEWKEIAA